MLRQGIIPRCRMWWRLRTATTPVLTKKAPHPDQQVHRIPRAPTRKQPRNRTTKELSRGCFAVTAVAMRHPREAAAVAKTIKVTALWIDPTIRRPKCSRAVRRPHLRPIAAMLEPVAIVIAVRARTRTAVPQALLVPIRRTVNPKRPQTVVLIPKVLPYRPALPLLLQLQVVAATPLATPVQIPRRTINPVAHPPAQLRKQPFIPESGRSKPAKIHWRSHRALLLLPHLRPLQHRPRRRKRSKKNCPMFTLTINRSPIATKCF